MARTGQTPDHQTPRYVGRVGECLDAIDAAGRRRILRPLSPIGPEVSAVASGGRVTLPNGHAVVDFSSNDYLGLRRHPALVAAASAAARDYGTGAGASRLVTGSTPLHAELEAELAALHGAEAAVVTSSGYSANLAALTALADLRGATFYSDELNHASIIDALRLIRRRSAVQVFSHANITDLEHALEHALDRALDQGSTDLEHDPTALPIIVTDAVFSMDGDSADLAALSDIVGRRDGLLVVDDAHEVFSPTSAPPSGGVVVVGTLSKRLAAQGGYVAGDAAVIDLIVNRARSLIFSTALAPPLAGAALAALRLERTQEGADRRHALRTNIAALLDSPVDPTRSPIIPVIVGSETAALTASEQLLAHGYLVSAIRPPTVAPGTSRLRIALSAAHNARDVMALRSVLDRLGLRVMTSLHAS